MPTPPLRETGRRRRGWLVTAALAVVVLTVLAVVWGLGGFGYRQDLFTDVAPGTVLSSGPYELVLTRATVQHKTRDKQWKVVVLGTGRTTGDSTLTPNTIGDEFLLAQDRRSREVQPVDQLALLTGPDILLGQSAFTPGLPPTPITASFVFDHPVTGDTVRVVVFQQEYTAKYVFGDELGWQPTKQAYDLTLPLRTLPATDY